MPLKIAVVKRRSKKSSGKSNVKGTCARKQLAGCASTSLQRESTCLLSTGFQAAH